MVDHWMAFSQAGPGGSLEVKSTIVRGYEVTNGVLGERRSSRFYSVSVCLSLNKYSLLRPECIWSVYYC
jgi:hypothetical protein